MKAMILAAGYGTRLHPLTLTIPKALVPVAGKPMLEWTILRLHQAGVRQIIINTHHLADQIHSYLQQNRFPGLEFEISYEDQILDTGGGIKKAGHFFADGQPFLAHNVDVVSSFDLALMVDFHRQHQALATIAVQKRPGSRLLLMDRQNRLRGRKLESENSSPVTDSGSERLTAVGFCGIHIIDPGIFSRFPADGVFPIFDVYTRLAAASEAILCYDIGSAYWLDLGKPSALTRLEQDLASGLVRL